MSLSDYPKDAALKDGREITIRPLSHGDFDMLTAFFAALTPEDRLFLRHDVTDPEVVGRWIENIDYNRIIPIVAEDRDRIVANGTLHMSAYGWSTHVGALRLIVARTHRRAGLGTLMLRELAMLAERRGLEKLHAEVIKDDASALRVLEKLGFKAQATLPGLVKDLKGAVHDLVVLITDVADVERILEDWIRDATQPAFRVPGEGAH